MLYTATADGGERALIDPMQVDPSGTTTLDAWQPDKEGRLLAYQLSEGGAEESVLRVLDVETGQDVDGPIDRCRYSGVAWLPGGKAFYYTRRLAPGDVPAGEEQYHRRIYLHQTGTPADDDIMIFGAGREKTNYYMASVSLDGRWLIVGAAAGTAPRNDLWLADLAASGESAPDLRVIQRDVDAQTTRQRRPGRPAVHLHRRRGAARAAADRRSGGAGGRRLAGEAPAGRRGRADRLRDPGRPGA